MSKITLSIHERDNVNVMASLRVGRHYAGVLNLPPAQFDVLQRQLCPNCGSKDAAALEVIDHTLEEVL
jgi:hypothetical protein